MQPNLKHIKMWVDGLRDEIIKPQHMNFLVGDCGCAVGVAMKVAGLNNDWETPAYPQSEFALPPISKLVNLTSNLMFTAEFLGLSKSELDLISDLFEGIIRDPLDGLYLSTDHSKRLTFAQIADYLESKYLKEYKGEDEICTQNKVPAIVS